MEGEEQEQQQTQQRSTARRDQLTYYQTLAQKHWQESKVFEVNAATKDEKTSARLPMSFLHVIAAYAGNIITSDCALSALLHIVEQTYCC